MLDLHGVGMVMSESSAPRARTVEFTILVPICCKAPSAAQILHEAISGAWREGKRIVHEPCHTFLLTALSFVVVVVEEETPKRLSQSGYLSSSHLNHPASRKQVYRPHNPSCSHAIMVIIHLIAHPIQPASQRNACKTVKLLR